MSLPFRAPPRRTRWSWGAHWSATTPVESAARDAHHSAAVRPRDEPQSGRLACGRRDHRLEGEERRRRALYTLKVLRPNGPVSLVTMTDSNFTAAASVQAPSAVPAGTGATTPTGSDLLLSGVAADQQGRLRRRAHRRKRHRRTAGIHEPTAAEPDREQLLGSTRGRHYGSPQQTNSTISCSRPRSSSPRQLPQHPRAYPRLPAVARPRRSREPQKPRRSPVRRPLM